MQLQEWSDTTADHFSKKVAQHIIVAQIRHAADREMTNLIAQSLRWLKINDTRTQSSHPDQVLPAWICMDKASLMHHSKTKEESFHCSLQHWEVPPTLHTDSSASAMQVIATRCGHVPNMRRQYAVSATDKWWKSASNIRLDESAERLARSSSDHACL